MKTFTRRNRMGLDYTLEELTLTTTRIRFHEKSIVVNASIMQMEEGWHRWIEMGNMIQDAFQFLSSNEREFIMTGITATEWDEMFGKTDETEHIESEPHGQPTDD